MDDNYIIRVYRRTRGASESHQLDELVGVVEDVREGRRDAFHNRDELWAILQRSTAQKQKQGRKRISRR